jgi:hypothetical protein
MNPPFPVDHLIALLRAVPLDNRVFILQSYIQSEGPIPDDRAPEVLELLKGTP